MNLYLWVFVLWKPIDSKKIKKRTVISNRSLIKLKKINKKINQDSYILTNLGFFRSSELRSPTRKLNL